MKASELRIGNYIKRPNGARYNGEIKQVSELTIVAIKSNDVELLPIPLTEEWLLKFGFEKFIYPPMPTAFQEIVSYSLNGLEYSTANSSCFRWYGGYCIENIKYVHQLQNLYFALTGKELILTL